MLSPYLVVLSKLNCACLRCITLLTIQNNFLSHGRNYNGVHTSCVSCVSKYKNAPAGKTLLEPGKSMSTRENSCPPGKIYVYHSMSLHSIIHKDTHYI
jgi:hypothetical protein